MYDDIPPYELFETDPAEITEMVSKYGVAILVEQVNSSGGLSMFREARKLANDRNDRGENGDHIVLNRERDADEAPRMWEIFSQPWMHTVAEAHFGAEPFVFNPEITLVTVRPGGRDPVPQVEDGPGLTFLLYVTEIGAGNGVMRCILGSHHGGKRLPSAEPTDRLVRLDAAMGSILVLDGDLTLRNAILREHPRITASARCYRA
ncbi:hypothetical protein NLX83_27095 [Allokutzneria sp. A3M-2-11 16]|uniref:hypothetical protein n=1 Tax=Allokutzneria sp. A3M-2-11 16 TaxID=2962043 RepID=UPI0020B83B90|nr:hypothetical protein [Allokutzneria sp. A3M-2-11 16]MCP3802947.1 hypothetical protein [Allokutzneria sp. A3M-2-11 16]